MDLIERDEFLEILEHQFKNIAFSEGRCVFITGEAGIGKTSLVKEFCRRHKDDCAIYQGACDALFTPRPLAPLYDIIWQVNPELWPSIPTIEKRNELFAAFYKQLTSLRQKTVIVFEDIHWADEATIDFVRFLARRITQSACLFIVTYRDEEATFYSPVKNILGQLPPDCFIRLNLIAFTKDAVTKLASAKGYNGEEVYSISGGNPFYVNEILASYSPGIPENIKDSILAVYDRLEEGTKHAWQLCSVIPEGLEINRFAKIKLSWKEALDHCFALKIIIVKNDRVIFKHELYRRTIEASLPPFKRIELNKLILDLFLSSFQTEGEIERIVQYAKNSNEDKLVVQYAPVAARQAAKLGSHTEASKLFLTAIEHAGKNDIDLLLQLYEEYAFECYLTNEISDAMHYAAKALRLWQEKMDNENIANTYHFLSRLWWISDNLMEAESVALAAVNLLKDQAATPAKAKVYAQLSQIKMLADLHDDCIAWGLEAVAMATTLGDKATLAYALGNVGAVKIRVPLNEEEGLQLLHESLQIALMYANQDYAGMAYTNLSYNCLIVKKYGLAEETLNVAIPYCEDNNLNLWLIYLLVVKAKLCLETGEWLEGYDIAHNLIGNPKLGKIINIYAVTIVATINMRKGNFAQVRVQLTHATANSFETREPQRIIQAISAFLEYEWITGERYIETNLLDDAVSMLAERGNVYGSSELVFWLYLARGTRVVIKEMHHGYQIDTISKAKQAAIYWKSTGCLYYQALALFAGTEDDKKEAITIVQNLGADAVYQKMKKEMRDSGIKSIPRGLRKSTKTNAAFLTLRELDVLQLLKEGMRNKEIASKLFVSVKTVDHHISSILFKLDADSRAKAVHEAVRQAIIK